MSDEKTEKMGKAARFRAKSLYEWEKQPQAYEKLFKDLGILSKSFSFFIL